MANKRHHPLFVGEKVYDCENALWVRIKELKGIYAVVAPCGKRKAYQITRGCLYQIAKGFHTCVGSHQLCYEHLLSQYPFYCPEFDENFFYIEAEKVF